MTFTEQFLAEAAEILKQIDVASVERVAATLAACRAGGGTLNHLATSRNRAASGRGEKGRALETTVPMAGYFKTSRRRRAKRNPRP